MPAIAHWSLLMLMLFAGSVIHAADDPGSGGINSMAMQDRPIVILISIDGFRWDYADRQETPALDRIERSGIRAESLVPVYPTLTFPNHYSIATGLYPANHGIVSNRFYSADRSKQYSLYDRETVMDGSWYRGAPVWVAAERAGMVTAAYYFVGTEAPIGGVPLTYWKPFDASVPGPTRVEQVLEWLALEDQQRPHFITLYFEDVDTTGHMHGPDSTDLREAVTRVDGYLGKLLDGIDALPIRERVYVLVVSDHGQRGTNEDPPFIIETVADLGDAEVIDHGTTAFVYFSEPDTERAGRIRDAINGAWDHGRAMLPEETPIEWRVRDLDSYADLIVQSDPGHTVFSVRDRAKWATPGDHGWVPEDRQMHGIFYASGPGLPAGARLPELSVVDIYPLMMKILQLPIESQVDSDMDLLPDLLETVPENQSADH